MKGVILGLLPLSALICGCEGRTADNMVPNGDTVEVVISKPTTSETADTVADSVKVEPSVLIN